MRDLNPGETVTLRYDGKYNGQRAVVMKEAYSKAADLPTVRKKYRVKLVQAAPYYMTRYRKQLILGEDTENPGVIDAPEAPLGKLSLVGCVTAANGIFISRNMRSRCILVHDEIQTETNKEEGQMAALIVETLVKDRWVGFNADTEVSSTRIPEPKAVPVSLTWWQRLKNFITKIFK